ncbi:DUF2254 domain-containing protein [Bradyrhizobium sp. McL0615]|uniref:DUF2254 domain-containing protein n=1 Tax=Bradyrhizobium sp. McL0615 TaxID=3415673 RepID=UPI003CF4D9F1
MRVWVIPMVYVFAAFIFGQVVPRLELFYLAQPVGISVSSAQACLSAAASGMMALTGVVFAVAFIMVQFSAVAYSPRLVHWFVRNSAFYHSIGLYSFTFIFAFFTLAWIDRNGSGKVPGYSTLAVGVLLMVSMFLFVRLVQRLVDLQITSVLNTIGSRGREVISASFRPLDLKQSDETKLGHVEALQLGPVSKTVTYSGPPRAITWLDIDALVREARLSGGIIAMACGIGDTLIDGSIVLRVHGCTSSFSETNALQAIHRDFERTFEQDPMYPIRILVDIAIKALSPAVNDPTTAVQAIDQIEDLLRRLIRKELDASHLRDLDDALRVIIKLPSWEDYMALAFDEIRQFGATSIQVLRRLRAALAGLADESPILTRAEAARRYLKQLDLSVDRSQFDAEDKYKAMQEDRQGLGSSRAHDVGGAR